MLSFTSCKPEDKLGPDFEPMAGKYYWYLTGTSDNNIWTKSDPSIDPARTGYTAEIELMKNERLIGIVSNHVEGNWPSCYFDV